jgi:hypothetical protein
LCDPRGGQVRYLIHFSEGGSGMRTRDEPVEPGAQTHDRSVAVEKGNVLVRRATVEDAVAVTALHGDLHRMHTEAHPDIFTVFDPTLTRPRFERLLADDDALIWIAESEGEPVDSSLRL